ncbi:hypothetical protein [Sulfurimonas sp. HSL-1716]|uniref:hypothetical protein n=1 Tax=Hydrocurvibacter sulfurireducens TaxID=3131937 RepID=UPI0031F72F75
MTNKKFSNTDIVLIDIIGFSHNTSKEQLEIITYLTKSYSKMIRTLLNNSQMSFSKMIEGIVPTGDGFYCILNPRLKGYGVILGLNFIYFSEMIIKRNKKFTGVKVAVHAGEVYPFTDILGHTNFIGDGLNDCSRYLQIKNVSPSALIASKAAFDSFEKFLSFHPDFEELMIERELKRSSLQEFEDKHGKIRATYLVWLRHSGIINPPNTNFNSLLM